VKTLVSIPDLEVEAGVRAPADPGVLALRVLAHDEHVDRRPALELGRHAVEQARGPEVRPEVEPLPERQQQAPERDVIRNGRIADGAEQHRVVAPQRLERVGRHHGA
jgi:hypothetical protein